METGMEGQFRGVWRCVCMNCVVVNVYGVTTGSLGKVEFNDFSVSSRTRRVLMRSIPAGSATVTSLRKPLNGFHGTHCSLVSEDKVMWILTTVSRWHCVWLRRFYWSLLGFFPPTQEVQRSGWVTQQPCNWHGFRAFQQAGRLSTWTTRSFLSSSLLSDRVSDLIKSNYWFCFTPYLDSAAFSGATSQIISKNNIRRPQC